MHLFAPSNGLSAIFGWKDPSNWCVSRLGITTRPKNHLLGGLLVAWRSQLFLSRGGRVIGGLVLEYPDVLLK